MGQRTALARLRSIREAQKRADALLAERDELIREAVQGENHPERIVAEAAGISHARVNQIVHRRR